MMQQLPNGLVLRHARREDAALVLDFIRALARYEKLEHEVVATREDLERTLFGERPHAEVVIAEHGGAAIGFMLFFPNYSTFLGRPGLYIEDLFIDPALRGRGFGRSLLACAAWLAVQRGWGRVEWAVLDWNEPALRFYAGVGARARDEWVLHRLTGREMSALAAHFPGV